MLRITAISAGMAGVEYLLNSAGCAAHTHAPEQQEPEGSSKGAEYLLKGHKAGEAEGVWLGNGLEMVGMTADEHVTPDDMRAIYGRLEHPETGDPLGRPPRQYADFATRLQAALAREPYASEERREQIRREVKARQKTACGYYDLTFTGRKSESIFQAALAAAGYADLAAVVANAHTQAVGEALAFIESQLRTTRVGRHATVTMDDGTKRTVGEYAAITGLVITLWQHSSSREGDPHLHTHAAVLNRVMTLDERIYALDAQQFKALKGAADLIYERRMEQLITEGTGARYAWRPDGKTREILGIDPRLCEESSGRSVDIDQRLQAMVEDYRNEHGHDPGRQALAAMRRQAWAENRAPKSTLSPEQIAAQYADKHGKERLIDQVRSVAEAAERVKIEGLPAGQPKFESEEALLAEAVRRTQETHATWDETALALELNKLLGEVRWTKDTAPAEVTRLIAKALEPNGLGDVVALKAKERVPVPEALRIGQRPDGEPIYHVGSVTRYCTRDQLSAEKQLVEQTQVEAGPRLDHGEVEEVTADLTGQGLSPDQLRAVVGILTSGKAADVLIGPAGTGKSKTVGELDRVWRERFGAPVLGLATSQRATEVLRGEGLEALNTAMFLTRYMPKDGGAPAEQLAPGTLIVVDEAGMADTDKLAKIAALVRKAGGKLLYTGDHEQLAAVGTGGLLRLLTKDASPYELVQVWRFKNEWEREASLRFRVGDTSVLAEYERRGRLRAGNKAEMVEAAVRGYMADVIEGLDSVLIVKTNEEAAALSARVRDELIALGRVSSKPLAKLRDMTFCGEGDLVQARLNDRHVDSQNGQMIVNREMLKVIGRDQRGRLELERTSDGSRLWLSQKYVAEHMTLGYAGTAHFVQGRTVETSHSLVEQGSSCNSVYVQVTRGTDANYLYGVCDVPADAHNLEAYKGSAADLVGEILEVDGGQVSATETYRAALEAGDSLSELGALWSLVARKAMADRHHKVLENLVGPERMKTLTQERAHQPLMARLAHAELVGEDVERLLPSIVDQQTLADAKSLSAVIKWRVEQAVDRGAELSVQGRWTKRLTSETGEVSEYAHDLGRLMDDRTRMMSRAAVLAPPEWALVEIGPMPDESDMYERRLWAAKVAAVQTYHEMYGIEQEQGIGPAPSVEHDPVQHVAWYRAWEALGRPVELTDQATQTEAELREDIARWEREQQWAPVFVANELKRATTLAEEYRREAATKWADVEAELTATGNQATNEVFDLIEQAERADRRVARFAEAAGRYARLHEARERWVEHTAPVAERAQLAAEELARREVSEPAEPTPAPGEAGQMAMLDEHGGCDTDYGRAADAAYEASAMEAELLPLDHEPAPTPEPAVDVLDAEIVAEEAAAEVVYAESTCTDLEPLPLEGELLPLEPDAGQEAELDAEVDIEEADVIEDADADEKEDASATVTSADATEAEERGDWGTPYRLADVGEADAGYPAPAEPEPEQLALFDEEAQPKDRISVGEVTERSEFRMRDAEVRAELADAKVRARELAEEVEAERKAEKEREAEAEAERKRAEAERERQEREALEAEEREADPEVLYLL